VRAAVFPDSEALAVSWLAAGVELATVGTDLRGWQAGDRRLVVVRIGGVPSLAVRIDNPRLDVDAYAESKESAHDLAQSARARLHEMPTGDFTGSGAVVAHVRDELGLRFLPDPDTGTPRYLFTVQLVVRPHP
jgi:hypothetical protein